MFVSSALVFKKILTNHQDFS
eukprot:UN09466